MHIILNNYIKNTFFIYFTKDKNNIMIKWLVITTIEEILIVL